ncbi:MAG: hypothetical protein HY717_03440 [Planctomycetes bacterium]|nr:hypothetical protein [Planctomycetota bacterium]
MKKILGLSTTLLACIMIGIFLVGIPVTAQRGAGGNLAAQNGDTNGDGQLDIADAVFLLLHLFRGGPEPVAIADSPELLSRLANLENQVTALSEENTTIRVAIQDLQSSQSDVPFFIKGKSILNIVFSSPCTVQEAERYEVKSGQANFLGLDHSLLAIRQGTIDSDKISFQTNREADLSFEFDYSVLSSQPQDLTFDLFLDGEILVSLQTRTKGTSKVFAFEIPAGEHFITVNSSGTCFNVGDGNPRAGSAMELSWLLVEYID